MNNPFGRKKELKKDEIVQDGKTYVLQEPEEIIVDIKPPQPPKVESVRVEVPKTEIEILLEEINKYDQFSRVDINSINTALLLGIYDQIKKLREEVKWRLVQYHQKPYCALIWMFANSQDNTKTATTPIITTATFTTHSKMEKKNERRIPKSKPVQKPNN